MPTKQFEQKIEMGQVLIAVGATHASPGANAATDHFASTERAGEACLAPTGPVGYCIGVDRYFKRDDVGIIYQMNVVPGRQRGLIGASLLKAQFERSAYGCRLYCCWCAQDIAANRFWEAMGFVPLAFRTGGKVRKKSDEGEDGAAVSAHSVTSSLRHSVTSARVHIFWQKRIRAGDETTPWWFPSQTTGGAIRSDRIVLPIPPGTHWSDAKPLILPDQVMSNEGQGASAEQKRLPTNRKSPIANRQSASPARKAMGGWRFITAAPPEAPPEAKAPASPKPKAPRRKAARNDPKLIAAARELRDRWLEQVNSGEHADAPRPIATKYDVRRAIAEAPSTAPMPMIDASPVRLLEAA